jgi:dipeptidyl aminopeptidase/acylaminoacyl peptidase
VNFSINKQKKLCQQITKLVVRLSCSSFYRRKRAKTEFQEKWINIAGGKKAYAHIHRPVSEGDHPGIVIVPGGLSPGTDYDKGTELTADDIAASGYAVLHYDPSGRGRTGGKEDYWGARHQDECAVALEWLTQQSYIQPNNIGIFSFSIGVTIAAGALARFDLPVKYLFDWEGPSNRFNITKNDTHKPLRGFPSSDVAFWKEREAIRFIGRITCDYFRYQAQNDHVQGKSKSHAIELVNAAVKGGVPWVRMNDNPSNILFDDQNIKIYKWIPPYRNHRAEIMKFLISVAKR